jgi:hypothetical protein
MQDREARVACYEPVHWGAHQSYPPRAPASILREAANNRMYDLNARSASRPKQALLIRNDSAGRFTIKVMVFIALRV